MCCAGRSLHPDSHIWFFNDNHTLFSVSRIILVNKTNNHSQSCDKINDRNGN